MRKSIFLRTFQARFTWTLCLGLTTTLSATTPYRGTKTVENDGIQWRYHETSRTVAVGDIHGDLNALIRILTNAQLINKTGKWIGGDALARPFR